MGHQWWRGGSRAAALPGQPGGPRQLHRPLASRLPCVLLPCRRAGSQFMGQLRPLWSIPAGENTHSKGTKEGWREAAGTSGSQVCGRSARTAVCPAPAPDVAWREGSGRGEGRERGGFLRSEDQFLPVWLPVPLWSRVFAPQHSAQPEASPFSARDAGPPERPGETLSSLLSAGPSFRATLPPARHCLPSPVHFRGFASSSRLTWSGRWSPPIKTHSRWATERKQGPL